MAQTTDAEQATAEATETELTEPSGLADLPTVERTEHGILESGCCAASIVMDSRGETDRLVSVCDNCGRAV